MKDTTNPANADITTKVAQAMRDAMLAGYRHDKAQGGVFEALRDLAKDNGTGFADISQSIYEKEIARCVEEGRTEPHKTSAARTIRATSSIIKAAIYLNVFDAALSKGKLAEAVKAAKAATPEAIEAQAVAEREAQEQAQAIALHEERADGLFDLTLQEAVGQLVDKFGLGKVQDAIVAKASTLAASEPAASATA